MYAQSIYTLKREIQNVRDSLAQSSTYKTLGDDKMLERTNQWMLNEALSLNMRIFYDIQFIRSFIYNRKNLPRYSLELAKLLLNHDTGLSKKDSLILFATMRKSYKALNRYTQELELRRKFAYLEKEKTKNEQLEDMKTKASLFYNAGMYDSAIVAYKQLYKLTDTVLSAQYSFLSNLNNLGVAYNSLGKRDSAMHYYHFGLEQINLRISEKKPQDQLYSLIYGNIGYMYLGAGDHSKGEAYIQKEIQHALAADYLDKLHNAYLNLCYVALINKDFEKANTLFQTALTTVRKKYGKNIEKALHMKRAEITLYRMQDKHEQALEVALEYHRRKDSFNLAQKQIETPDIIAGMGLNKREHLLDHNLKLLKVYNHKNQIQKQLLVSLSIALLIIISTIIVLYQTLKRIRSSKTQIEQQKQVIEAALKEKEILLKEIHHRVKNNLQVISGLLELQSSKLEDAQLQEIFQVGQNRINSMSLIHEQLYRSENLKEIQFSSYILALVGHLKASHTHIGQEVKFLYDLDDSIHLEIYRAVPLGLIVNEILVNAFKHAFVPSNAGVIEIKLHKNQQGNSVLIIQDNGVGVSDLGVFTQEANTAGITIIRALTQQIQGKLEFKQEKGIQVNLEF
ncbi:MAG: hypothetical protein OIF50_08300 [Flavobacteriaceae bacterium]|nr:hypothetical protein [Flavobacteriaceae bacterium]